MWRACALVIITHAHVTRTHRRGQESANLCFLVKGELEFLSPVDDESVEMRLTPEKLAINDAMSREVLVLTNDDDHSDGVQGCFGHSVMKGERRRNNCRLGR